MSRKAADQGTTKLMQTKPRKARKRLPTTPRSQVRRAVAMIFTRSRERSAAIKRTGNCCEDCGAKFRPKDTRNGPKLKCEVHHLDGGHLDEIVDEIFKWLLCPPERLRPVCVPCHERIDGRSEGQKHVCKPQEAVQDRMGEVYIYRAVTVALRNAILEAFPTLTTNVGGNALLEGG